ncbi:unnamed protein product [Cyclocybe aegerita]|uniref:F-box domain-containing protein n=1 Tax=Cyclocybe aegerita TaxID=1973307 RepID=A0A8S0WHI0_CYCAE|nr:unnamed protein product [Cyclocybe aegerita]
MASSLAPLLEELIFEVMIYLDSPSIICMALTCHSFYDVFQSKPIRYIYELGMNDIRDTGSNRPPDELLALLHDWQRAWAELDWKSIEVVKIQRNLGPYKLVAGTFSLSDGDVLSVTYLPSASQPGHTISLDIEPRNFAIDASQDLIILLDTSAHMSSASGLELEQGTAPLRVSY